MATPKYEWIASQVLTSSAASVTFSSIPGTYRDLVLICDVTATATAALRARFNNDTGGNYSRVTMTGNGSSANSYSGTNDSLTTVIAQLGTSAANIAVYNIMDYTATDKHKSVLARYNNTSQGVETDAYRWANTSAINEIDVFPSNDNFAAGSTFHLYGVN